jgi:hypothetical protein
MFQRRHRVIRSITAIAVLSGSGCYAYVPGPATTPEPGATVRADLTDEAAIAITSTLGPGVLSVSGLVYEREADALGIVVSSYTTARSGELGASGEPLRFRIDQIRQIQQKQLARGRSILLGALFLGGAAVLTTVLANEGRQVEDEDPPDPGPNDIVVPRRSIPLLKFGVR